jgi:photosystem II stability/assembly factor-like uncharacterized protein
MRSPATLLAAVPVLLVACLLPGASRAAELRNFDDAALHAVQFVDGREGWAVGDEGVVWHTINAGKSWERQPTGVRGSLRSVHFFDPYVGWIVGREETAAGSVGVVLYTQDGGIHWRQALRNTLPGFNRVCFADEKNGYLLGDGSDAYPSGLFVTHDGGKNWRAVPGPRCPSWYAADFTASGEGALGGAANHLGIVQRDRLTRKECEADLGIRAVRGLQLRDRDGIAVAEGGVVLVSDGSSGVSWLRADLHMLTDLDRNWDFHAVHGVGRHWWVVGRPGSVALHSPDRGRTWETVRTGQPMPLHGVFFSDEEHGWAVGEMGTIVATADGGRSWRIQHRGGDRTPVLFVHARAAGSCIDAVAAVGAREGFLTAGVCVTAPELRSAAPRHVADGPRFAAAMRQAGGAAGEMLWQFPLPSHLRYAGKKDLLHAWNTLHDDKAAEQLLRQLVLAVRIWRPDVIVTDSEGAAEDAVVAEVVREAFVRAADPKSFPEQIGALGLAPWTVSKLYGVTEGKAGDVTLDLMEMEPSLEGTIREFVAGPAGLLGNSHVPLQRSFCVLAARMEGATGHRWLMEGVELARGGMARRPVTMAETPTADEEKTFRQRSRLVALAEAPVSQLTGPERLLGQIGPSLAALPDDQAARAAHAIAWQFARRGQWALARETFQLLVDRYPAHPLSEDACRWLLLHNSSSEARRRHELGQFVVLVAEDRFGQPRGDEQRPGGVKQASFSKEDSKDRERPVLPNIPQVDVEHRGEKTMLSNAAQAQRWYQSSLDLEKRLAEVGPLASRDPALQFCVQSSRRSLGQTEEALKWYQQFANRQPPGPWRSAALAELWLARKDGPCPKPLLSCRETDARPVLDGQLDDACWQKAVPVRLQNALGDTGEEYPTAVRMSHDNEFLYLAVQCKHPAGGYVAPVKVRGRDADLRAFDRISIYLDLDRDYNTAYHFQIDQRGCVSEECWHDKSWDPRWFVAVKSTAEGWTAEAAIPLAALTGDRVTAGKAWACNVVRVLPGRGVQAFSLPAEVPEESLRLEGMGLVLFGRDGPAPRETLPHTPADERRLPDVRERR